MLPASISLGKLASPMVLCIGAHCDDIEIGCGATLINIVSECPNVKIVWFVLSSNETRRQETAAAFDLIVGNNNSGTLITKDFRDGYLPYQGGKVKESFEELRRSINPDVIFTHFLDDRHQDHREVSNLTWNTFRDHLILEYEIPKYEGDLGRPNVFSPVSREVVDRKLSIIMNSYLSQHEKHWFDDQSFRSLMRLRGLEAGPGTEYAEAFHCRKMTLHAF